MRYVHVQSKSLHTIDCSDGSSLRKPPPTMKKSKQPCQYSVCTSCVCCMEVIEHSTCVHAYLHTLCVCMYSTCTVYVCIHCTCTCNYSRYMYIHVHVLYNTDHEKGTCKRVTKPFRGANAEPKISNALRH